MTRNRLDSKLDGMKPQEIGLFDTKTHLSEIIEKVQQGQRFVITKRGRPVAELRPLERQHRPLERGCLRNEGYWMAPDFDDTPEDFGEYL